MDMYCKTLLNLNINDDLPMLTNDVNTVARDILYRTIKEELASAGVKNAKALAAKIVLSYTKRTS